MGVHPYRSAPSDTQYTQGELAWFRRPLGLLLLTLASCVRLAHVEPQARDHVLQRAATVTIEVDCDSVFGSSKTATGVIISERHVLTAAHAVRCGEIPDVHVTYQMPNGEDHRIRMVVTHDDLIYGQGRDIARLEIASAETFGVEIPPPELSNFDSDPPPVWCAYLRDSVVCGEWSYSRSALQVGVHPGDSGAAVYDEHGRLVGLIVRGNDHEADVEVVEPRWLSGT